VAGGTSNPDNTVKGGKIVDKDGKVIGTYTRISFDDFTPQANEVVFGLGARAKAMNQAIAAFGIGTVTGARGGGVVSAASARNSSPTPPPDPLRPLKVGV